MTPDFLLILAMSDATRAPVLAVIDKFWIILAIAIGSIILEWLKRRRSPGEPGSTEESESHRTTTPTAPPLPETRPTATSDWEEELRRLLGGKPPEARPPQVPTPEPTSAPPVRPVVIQMPRHVPEPPATSSIPPPLAGTIMAEAERSVEVRFPTLKESATAYQRASRLQDQVIERLKHVEEMTERHLASVPTAHRPAVSTDAVRSIALIRNRNTVRQAIVAALIFGPPKGLENE
jgi:hypothetical protein